MIHADLALATRLELAAAEIGADAAAAHRRLYPESSAECLPFGTGAAIFIDEQSPLTQIRGAGMSGVTAEAALDEVEEFFAARMAPVTFLLSPFADAALFTYLTRRGYEYGAFENVLVREVSTEDIQADPDVIEATDRQEWGEVMSEAFFDTVSSSAVELGSMLFELAASRSYLVRNGAEGAAAAQLAIRNGIGILQCDGTLRRYREAGLQKKLIRARLSAAAAMGCELATADTQPGSLSQRNYEKLGFRVAYTRVTLIKPCF